MVAAARGTGDAARIDSTRVAVKAAKVRLGSAAGLVDRRRAGLQSAPGPKYAVRRLVRRARARRSLDARHL